MAMCVIIVSILLLESDDGMNKKVYRHLDKLPTGRAGDKLTPGCLVLEGGRLERALYGGSS